MLDHLKNNLDITYDALPVYFAEVLDALGQNHDVLFHHQTHPHSWLHE